MNKDTITTVLGAAGGVATAVIPVLNGVTGSMHQADWMQLVSAVFMTLLGYFTNKK